MLNQIKKFMLDDSGLETVEWAIVGGLLVLVTAVVFGDIGTAASLKLRGLEAEVTGTP
jgi:Flp pilus assembly pilin Flp